MTDRSFSPYRPTRKPTARHHSPFKPNKLHEESYFDISPFDYNTDAVNKKPHFVASTLPEFGKRSAVEVQGARKTSLNTAFDNVKRSKEITKSTGIMEIPEKDRAFLSMLKASESANHFQLSKEPQAALARFNKSPRSSVGQTFKPPLPKSTSKSKPKILSNVNELSEQDIEKSDWSSLVRSIVLGNKKISRDSTLIQEEKSPNISGIEAERPAYSRETNPYKAANQKVSRRSSLNHK